MSRNFEILTRLEGEHQANFGHASPHRATADWAGEHVGAKPAATMAVRPIRPDLYAFVQHALMSGARTPKIVAFSAVGPAVPNTVCAETAAALASSGCRQVCVLDANFGGGFITSHFGLQTAPGFGDALLGAEPILNYARVPSEASFSVVPLGTPPMGWQTLLQSEVARERVLELSRSFDCLLIDAHALENQLSLGSLGGALDGMVLTLEANTTRREQALQAARWLQAAEIRLLGAVLNNFISPVPAFVAARL